MITSKPWWKSKTDWLHIIVLLSLLVGAILKGNALDPKFAADLVIVQSVLGILIRSVTNTAIDKPDAEGLH